MLRIFCAPTWLLVLGFIWLAKQLRNATAVRIFAEIVFGNGLFLLGLNIAVGLGLAYAAATEGTSYPIELWAATLTTFGACAYLGLSMVIAGFWLRRAAVSLTATGAPR